MSTQRSPVPRDSGPIYALAAPPPSDDLGASTASMNGLGSLALTGVALALAAGFDFDTGFVWGLGMRLAVKASDSGSGFQVPSRMALGRQVESFLRPASDIGTRPFGGSVIQDERSSPLIVAIFEPGSTHTAL